MFSADFRMIFISKLTERDGTVSVFYDDLIFMYKHCVAFVFADGFSLYADPIPFIVNCLVGQ